MRARARGVSAPVGGVPALAAVKVRLIDGDELAELMIDYNVGVANEETYIVKKLDSDFFDDLAM